MEVDADLKELVRMKKEHAAIEERLRQLKKEFGWIDYLTLIDTRKENGGPMWTAVAD